MVSHLFPPLPPLPSHLPLLLQPQASRVPGPSVWEPSGIGRGPPKRPGVGVAVLTAAVGGQACTWEGWEESQQQPRVTAAQTLPSSLPSCRLRLQIPEGTDQKAKWTFGLGHRPASLSARPPTSAAPLSTLPSQPEGSVKAKQG